MQVSDPCIKCCFSQQRFQCIHCQQSPYLQTCVRTGHVVSAWQDLLFYVVFSLFIPVCWCTCFFFSVFSHFLCITHSPSCRSALQSLHKACEVARCHNYYPGSLFLTWVSYYQTCISSDQYCINEWNAMQDVQSHRSDSPVLFTDL